MERVPWRFCSLSPGMLSINCCSCSHNVKTVSHVKNFCKQLKICKIKDLQKLCAIWYVKKKKKYPSNLVKSSETMTCTMRCKRYSFHTQLATLPVHMTDLFLSRQRKVLGRRMGNWLLEGKEDKGCKMVCAMF